MPPVDTSGSPPQSSAPGMPPGPMTDNMPPSALDANPPGTPSYVIAPGDPTGRRNSQISYAWRPAGVLERPNAKRRASLRAVCPDWSE